MNLHVALLGAWLAMAGAGFVNISAVSYGNVPLTDNLVSRLRWLDSWQFSI